MSYPERIRENFQRRITVQITIDGQATDEIINGTQTLGQVLEKVKGILQNSGRMIIAIKCNEHILKPEEVESALGRSVEQYETIDFQTASPAQLARDALQASKELLEQTVQQVNKLVEYLQQSQIPQAMEQMGTTFQALNNIYQGINGCLQLLKVEPESIELSTINAARLFTKITGQLQDIKSALANRDYVQLADLLAYELVPTMNNCNELIDVLLSNIPKQTDLT